MNVHPKFDSERSDCTNCAAFSGTVKDGIPMGTCHRHAPRPSDILLHFPPGIDTEGPSETNPKGFCWPDVDDDYWCLEWVPRNQAFPGGAQP